MNNPAENPTSANGAATPEAAPPENIPAAAPQLTPTRLPPLWRNRDYMLLWSGQTVSALGSGISGIALPLLILALTNSPAAAGIAGALYSLPYLLFSLPVGALIDRWDRKRVMILCEMGRALNVASIPVALAFDILTVWQLYIVFFIEGTLFVFFNIAEVATLPRVVNKAQLPAASAQNEVAFGVAGLAGPPLGGFMYQALGRMVPFIFDAISYAVSLVSLFFIKTEFQGERPATERNLRGEIVEGLSWLWHQPLIRFMAVLTGGMNLVYSASGLVLIIAARNMGATATEIGTIFSIGALGGILGSIVGGKIQRRFRFGQVITAVIWLQALLFPLYAFAPHVLVLGAVSAAIFMLTPIYNVVQFSYRLSLIPDALQGRVNSSFRLLAFGFQPLGASLSGVMLENIGVAATIFALFGWLLLLAVATTFNSHVRHARPIEEVAQAA
ncbi:MAG TPA: MFS transporter [Chloroflexia bacterium]